MAKPIYQKEADGKFHCHETKGDGTLCTSTFDLPTGLGIHRKIIHGVTGTSPAAVKWRAAKIEEQERTAKSEREARKIERKEKKNALSSKGNVEVVFESSKKPLPEVPQDLPEDPQTTLFEADLAAIKESALKEDLRSALLPCPSCDRTFKGQRWLSNHINSAHPELSENKTAALERVPKGHKNNGNQNTSHDQYQGFETVTRTVTTELVTYAVGQIQNLCSAVAYQNDLPSRDFARRCALYFSAIAGGK